MSKHRIPLGDRIRSEGRTPSVVAKALQVLKASLSNSDERREARASLLVIFLTSSRECLEANRQGGEQKHRLRVKIS